MDEYHRISDVAMDRLLESLEAVVDSQDSDQHEVDYHVRLSQDTRIASNVWRRVAS